MKKKQTKQKKQVIEIHIYVHQTPNWSFPNNTPPNPIINPPYYVTC